MRRSLPSATNNYCAAASRPLPGSQRISETRSKPGARLCRTSDPSTSTASRRLSLGASITPSWAKPFR
eukprot:12339704-Heterocapsa_arctica.AAC.1